MTTRYLTVAEEKAYIRSELKLEDSIYEAAIQTAEMIIDNGLQRKMVLADVAASARVYTPDDGSTSLIIHDCTEITSVVDFYYGTLTSATQYLAKPLNAMSATGEPWPYYQLDRLASGYQYQWTSIGRPAGLTVTAKWGWPSIPPLVKESCKIIAKDVFNMRNSGVGFGLVAITEAGGVGTRDNAIVLRMLETYAHPASIGLA